MEETMIYPLEEAMSYRLIALLVLAVFYGTYLGKQFISKIETSKS